MNGMGKLNYFARDYILRRMASIFSGYDAVDGDKFSTVDRKSDTHPLDAASLWSEFMFTWVTPVIKLGAERQLEASDIYPVPSFLKCESVMAEISENWKLEIKRTNNPRLGLVLVLAFWKSIMFSTFSFLMFVLCSIAQPYLVTAILQYVQNGEVNFLGITSGITIALIMGLVSLLGAFGFNLGWYFINHFSMRVKTSLLSLIFDKSLTISVSSRQKFKTGDIMTLLSVDVERIWNALGLACWYWIVPVMCTVTVVLLYLEVGVGALYCAATLLLWSIFQQKVGYIIGNVRLQLVAFTAERVNLTKEVLQGVRLVKLYAWERATEDKIASIRSEEVKLLSTYQILKMISTGFQFLAPVLITFVVFASYGLAGGLMTQQKTFTVLAILNLLRLPIFAISIMFSDTAEAVKGLDRIKHYLSQADLEPVNSDCSSGSVERRKVPGRDERDDDVLVKLHQASFSWEDVSISTNTTPKSDADMKISSIDRRGNRTANRELEFTSVQSPIHDPSSYTLKNISLQIRRGEMVAVVGSVGAGKSSLLSAILGHSVRVSGSQVLQANVAYVPQEHWIQNMSLKENIVFNSAWDLQKYNDVIDVSQLRPDINILPDGDMTQIGERGINISGGQKARSSIARALYAPEVDLYLFDDPLSAVDAHVCQSIFNEAFVKYLAGKARVVVLSSNYHLLPNFDTVCVLDGGHVHVFTCYDDLVETFPQYGTIQYSTQPPGASGSLDEVVESGVIDRTVDDLELEDEGNHSDKAKVVDDNDIDNPLPLNAKICSVEIKTQKKSTVLVEEEDRQKGVVSLGTYIRYFGAAYQHHNFGGILAVVLLSMLFMTGQALRVLADMWLGFWSSDIEENQPDRNNAYYLRWYFVIIGGAVIFVFCRGYMFISSCMLSSKNLHRSMLAFLLRAPVNLYFDVVPLGRILNRVSADMDKVDSHLPDFFLQSIQNLLHCFSIILLCVFSMPYFIILLVPMGIVFTYVQHYFRKTSREVKRLESVSRSPLYVLCNEVIQGMPVIRAFAKQEIFRGRHRELMDENCRQNFMYWMVARWISIRLELLSNVVVLFVGVMAVLVVDAGGQVDGNMLGLAMVYSVQLTGLLQWTVRIIISTEDSMTSVERIAALEKIKQEKDRICNGDPPSGLWPSKGQISLRKLNMRYRPDLPLVLRDVSVEIPGGCKVGIIGRTGSGKSSLVQALFRLVEPEGSSVIEIDGYDTMAMGLECLRSHLTVIPQDPIMFSGSIRFNLDPFNRSTDSDIWEALDRARLKNDIFEKIPDKLNHIISENGDNLSVGQKQLMCIARALLRKSRVIILDEATASIDSATDQMIQRTVRHEFNGCTVLTIAHRIDTILDYDRILVMDDGRAVEYAPPKDLMEKRNGFFKALVEKTKQSHSRKQEN